MTELARMGLQLIGMESLMDFYDLPEPEQNIFDR